MRNVLIVCLAVGVAAAAAFFLWSGSSPAVTPIVSDPWEREAQADPAQAIEAEDTAGAGFGDEDPAALDDTPEGLLELTREELEGANAEPRLLKVQVWDQKRGVPAAKADVHFLEEPEGLNRWDPFAQHRGSLVLERGQRFRTGEDGRVELPAVQRRAFVVAQRQGLFGMITVSRRHRRLETITMQVDETVTVRVVDAQDRPVAGAPVGVAQKLPERTYPKVVERLTAQMNQLEREVAGVQRYLKGNPAQAKRAQSRIKEIRKRQGELKRGIRENKGDRDRGRGRGRGRSQRRGPPAGEQAEMVVKANSQVRTRRRTDRDGIAVFEHFQAYRRGQEKWWPQEHVDQFEAVLLMPLREPQASDFSGRPVPKDTIELRMPPIGSLMLRMVDLDGRPYTHPVHADLRVQAQTPLPWSRMAERKKQDTSEILFPFVGLGLQFSANFRLDDEDFKWSIPAFAGPTNPGEQVTVDVVVAPEEGMLFGRLLNDEGQPIPGLRPSFLINTSIGRLEGEDVTTDKDGRFHLPYQVRDKHQPPFSLEVRNNTVRPLAGLTMRLSGLPAGRVTDLGDLQLDNFGVVAFGVVTDDRGQPVKGATLQLQRERWMDGEPMRMAFVDEAFVTSRSDAEGRYEIFGDLEPSRYRLRVAARRHFNHETRNLRIGEQLDVQLLRNSKIVGTVLLPPWLKSSELRAIVQSADDPRWRREDRIFDYLGKKFIHFDGVRPGIYSVSLRLRGFPDPIHRVDGLQVLPGQTGVHPRLLDLDFSAFLHRFELTAVDQNGQSIRPRWPLLAKVTRPGGETAFVGFPWKGSKLQVISASPNLEVTPYATGYLAESRVLAAGANQVLFQKLAPVEVVLPGLRGLVGDAMVWVKLQPTKGTGIPKELAMWDDTSKRVGRQFVGAQRRNFGAILGQDDRVQVPMMMAGTFQVTVYLLSMGKKRTVRPLRVVLDTKITLPLQLGDNPHRVVAGFDVKKMQDAVTQLAQQEAAAAAGK